MGVVVAVFVNANAAGVKPATEADTAYEPAIELACGRGLAAIPEEFVTAVAVADPEKVAVAPEEGAVNVTVAPLTGFE